jgi:hypothetical protein
MWNSLGLVGSGRAASVKPAFDTFFRSLSVYTATTSPKPGREPPVAGSHLNCRTPSCRAVLSRCVVHVADHAVVVVIHDSPEHLPRLLLIETGAHLPQDPQGRCCFRLSFESPSSSGSSPIFRLWRSKVGRLRSRTHPSDCGIIPAASYAAVTCLNPFSESPATSLATPLAPSLESRTQGRIATVCERPCSTSARPRVEITSSS